jgi:DNA sulfur modification protein DndC
MQDSIKDKISNIVEEIKLQYIKDKTPWVIGYSGGKDSTATLELVLSSIS